MTEGGIADHRTGGAGAETGQRAITLKRFSCCAPTAPRWRSWRKQEPLDTTGMRLERRISAVYKDIPGGQLAWPNLRLHPSPARFYPAGKRRSADADHRRQRTAAVAARFSLLASGAGARSLKRIAAHSRMTSPARRVLPCSFFRLQAVDARRRRLICWRWPTPFNAVTGATTYVRGRSQLAAISTYRLCRKSWDLR